MQKIATRVFIYASVAFGIFGILFVLTNNFGKDAAQSDLNHIFQKLVLISVFTILPSFALSVAGKYLNGRQ